MSRTDRANRRVNRIKAGTQQTAAGPDAAGAVAAVVVEKPFDCDGLDVDSIELDPIAAEALAAHGPAVAFAGSPAQIEQRAMVAVSEALALLDADARVRVLEWAARTCRVQHAPAATERPRLRLGRRITDPFLEAGEFDTLFAEPQVPAKVDAPASLVALDIAKPARKEPLVTTDAATSAGPEPVATLLTSFVEDFQKLAQTVNGDGQE